MAGKYLAKFRPGFIESATRDSEGHSSTTAPAATVTT